MTHARALRLAEEDSPLAQRGAVTVLPRRDVSRHVARAIPDRSRLLDRCSRCDLLNPPAVVALDHEHRSIVGCYRCPRCGYAWWTSWDPEFVA